MKWNIRVVSVALVLLMSFLLVGGCAPGVPKELKAPEITIAGVYPLQLGAGSIDYEVVFNVKNPNSVMVVLDTLEWNISTDYKTILDEDKSMVLGRRQLLNDVYIPANTSVQIPSAFAVALGTVIGEVYMAIGSGALAYLPKTMQELISTGQMDPASAAGMVSVGAIAQMFPLWKLLGASRPPINVNLDTYLEMSVWDASPAGPPSWTAQGTASFLSAAGPLDVTFSDQWKSE